jgi:hypothetical protein
MTTIAIILAAWIGLSVATMGAYMLARLAKN